MHQIGLKVSGASVGMKHKTKWLLKGTLVPCVCMFVCVCAYAHVCVCEREYIVFIEEAMSHNGVVYFKFLHSI